MEGRMENYYPTPEMLEQFAGHLAQEEKSVHTVEKYMRDIRKFIGFLGYREITKELAIAYKKNLAEQYAASSVNSMLASFNQFMEFAGWRQFKVRQIKVQRRLYCPEEKELTKEEYYRLVRTAGELNKDRLSLIIQTICSTGIRVSELVFITVNSIQSGIANVECKGKSRQVFLPKKLRILLRKYVRQKSIWRGPVFVTREGKPVNRSNVWKEMKDLCRHANVSDMKVFPHNLRHLFARTYYKMEKDISKLADLLGHSSINTTRIYIITSGTEHRRQIERMRLIL